MAITKVIDPIPEAPQRGVDTQEQFDQKADAFLKRLETLDDDLNEWKDQCNATAQEVNVNAQVASEAREVCEAIGTSNGYKGEWDSGTTYSQGDVVSYSGYLWLSKQDNNLGNIPQSDSTWWFLIQGSEAIYVVGDVDTDVSVGDPVYFDVESGIWKKAEIYSTQAIYDGLGRIVFSGKAKGLTGLVGGQLYYNSNGSLQKVTASKEADIVGTAIDESTLLVNIIVNNPRDKLVEFGKVVSVNDVVFYGIKNGGLCRAIVSVGTSACAGYALVSEDGYLASVRHISEDTSGFDFTDVSFLGSSVVCVGGDKITKSNFSSYYQYSFTNQGNTFFKCVLPNPTNDRLFVAGTIYDSAAGSYYPTIIKLYTGLGYEANIRIEDGAASDDCAYYAFGFNSLGELVAVGYTNGAIIVSKFHEDLSQIAHAKITGFNSFKGMSNKVLFDSNDNIIFAITDYTVRPGDTTNTSNLLIFKISSDLSTLQMGEYFYSSGTYLTLDIAIDQSDNLYILDSGSRLVTIDSSGNIIDSDEFYVGFNLKSIDFVGENLCLVGNKIVIKHKDNDGLLLSTINGYLWDDASFNNFSFSGTFSLYSPTIGVWEYNSLTTTTLEWHDVVFEVEEDYWE